MLAMDAQELSEEYISSCKCWDGTFVQRKKR